MATRGMIKFLIAFPRALAPLQTNGVCGRHIELLMVRVAVAAVNNGNDNDQRLIVLGDGPTRSTEGDSAKPNIAATLC